MVPSIAIVGAGPGGLTLARLLEKAGIQYTVFEMRSIPDPTTPQPPSGSLDLHTGSGQYALQACGLHEAFLKLTRPGSEDLVITDKHGTVLHTDQGHQAETGESRLEIDRSQLTDLLLSSVSASNIKWDHKLLSITPSSTSADSWTLNFDNNLPSQTFDLVIGADGAWSRVRSALSDIKPYYSTINGIILTIPSIDTAHPQLSALVGRGSLFACGDGKSLICQRGSNSVRVYALISSPSPTYLTAAETGLDALSNTELKHILTTDSRFFSDWGINLKQLIMAASEEDICYFPPMPLYMLPVGYRWVSRPGVTLLGDAAHLMTPFAGEGVNAAMLDAVHLFREIVKVVSRDGETKVGNRGRDASAFASITKRYEEAMFVRAEEKAKESYGGLELMFGEDAPKGLVKMMSQGPPLDVGA